MKEEEVKFEATDEIILVGKFALNPDSRNIAIITHPYGPVGGNMENHVVIKAAEIMYRFGFSTLRFNFRGVSPSQGRTSWTGASEVLDVLEAVKYTQSKLKSETGMEHTQIVLVGYSFGSMIATKAAIEIPNLIGLISISYPSQVMWALTLFNSNEFTSALPQLPDVPKLFISTKGDTFSSELNWKTTVDQASDPKELVMLDGNHFWTDDLSYGQLVDTLTNWVRATFN
jgi:alpha/beta superfamily hydrolase